MVSFYTLINNDKNYKVEFNEIIFIECMKVAKQRNRKLYEQLINIYEELNNKDYSEEVLNY